jgi:hypothetical protein
MSQPSQQGKFQRSTAFISPINNSVDIQLGGAGIYEGLVPCPRQLEGGQNLGKLCRPLAYLSASEEEWYSDLNFIHLGTTQLQFWNQPGT